MALVVVSVVLLLVTVGRRRRHHVSSTQMVRTAEFESTPERALETYLDLREDNRRATEQQREACVHHARIAASDDLKIAYTLHAEARARLEREFDTAVKNEDSLQQSLIEADIKQRDDRFMELQRKAESTFNNDVDQCGMIARLLPVGLAHEVQSCKVALGASGDNDTLRGVEEYMKEGQMAFAASLCQRSLVPTGK